MCPTQDLKYICKLKTVFRMFNTPGFFTVFTPQAPQTHCFWQPTPFGLPYKFNQTTSRKAVRSPLTRQHVTTDKRHDSMPPQTRKQVTTDSIERQQITPDKTIQKDTKLPFTGSMDHLSHSPDSKSHSVTESRPDSLSSCHAITPHTVSSCHQCLTLSCNSYLLSSVSHIVMFVTLFCVSH